MLVKPVRGIRLLTSNTNINMSTFSTQVNAPLFPSSTVQENNIREFVKEEVPSFYLCRYTSEGHLCQGIIAQIDCKFLNKRIIKHEEYFIEKLAEFHKNFSDFNFQTAPTLLFHKKNSEVETSVDRIMGNKHPDLTFYSYKCKYELWILLGNEKFKELYNSIDNLYIADGHHRISHLSNLQMNALAYIVPESHLRSYPIIRKYNDYCNIQINDLIKKIKQNFSLNVLDKKPLDLLHRSSFVLSHNMQKLHISPSDSAEFFQQILSVFSSINFTPEGQLNFTNYIDDLEDGFSPQTNIIKSRKDLNQFNFHLCIPAITPKTIHTTLSKPLPIHSTWFEPKIPSGIIGMELCDPVENSSLDQFCYKGSYALRI